MNKKGSFDSLMVVMIVLFVLVIAGIGIAILVSVVDWVADETLPVLSDLGMVESANLTEYADYTIDPANDVIQSFMWLGGVIYLFGLVGCVGLAFVVRFTGNKWLMGLFIVFMLMLILASIFISNIYEEFYNDTGDLGSRLKEQTLLSWLILYSPVVMSVIGFFSGIIMFTGEQEEVGF